MGTYDSRHITLDPGLTAIALRGLHEREGHYPFLDRFVRRLRLHRVGRASKPTGQRASAVSSPLGVPVSLATRRRPSAEAEARVRASFWPRSFRAAELFPTFNRAIRRTSSAAA